jgi:hypothetical protein
MAERIVSLTEVHSTINRIERHWRENALVSASEVDDITALCYTVDELAKALSDVAAAGYHLDDCTPGVAEQVDLLLAQLDREASHDS